MSKELLEPAFQTMLPMFFLSLLSWVEEVCVSADRKSCNKQEGRLPFEVWVTSWDFRYLFYLIRELHLPVQLLFFFFALFGVKMVFMLLTHMCCIAPLGIIWRHLTLARWSTGHVVCRFCKSGCTASEACGFLTCIRLAQAHWCTFLCQV